MPLQVGELVATTTVRDVRAGRDKRVPWRPDGVSVLVFLHTGCGDCAAFLHLLDDGAARFATWGARLRVVTTDAQRAQRLAERVDLDVLLDEGGQLHRALEVSEAGAALLVLDVHGQVFFSSDLEDHDFPPLDDLFQEARFPALQCPECETPDVPSRILTVPRSWYRERLGPAGG